MRFISTICITVLSLSLLGCGETPVIDDSANQPNISLTVNVNEEAIVVTPDNVGNGKLTLDITNNSQDIRQVKVDGLGVNVTSLPIPAKDGKQQMILNLFTQKGKLIISSTDAEAKKRLEANITIK